MKKEITLLVGCIMGGLSVAIGAFGAHGLRDMLAAANRTDTFELAVRYQFYHTFALIACGLAMHYYPAKTLRYASVAFLIGIVLFSGSLYVLCFTGLGALGMITPLGGLSMIAGWILLALGIKNKKALPES